MSEIIKEHDIQEINLLKLDAENVEWGVLSGIDGDDRPKIKQIAMDVHTHIPGGENLLEEIKQLLDSKGYRMEANEGELEKGMGVYMLYAKLKHS